MPISVGNGQQIAPNIPKPSPKPKPKPKTSYQRGAQSFSNALGVGPAATRQPFSRQRKEARRRLKKIAHSLPGRPTLKQVDKAHEGMLTDVFDAQSKDIQDRIIENAISDRTTDGDVILKHAFRSSGDDLERKLAALRIGTGSHRTSGLPGALNSVGQDIARFIQPGHSAFSLDTGPNEAQRLLGRVGRALGAPDPREAARALSDPSTFLKSPDAVLDPRLGDLARKQKTITDVTDWLSERAGRHAPGQSAGFGGGEIATNALKDAINIPAQAIPSLYLPASEALSGDTRGAVDMLAQPYVDLARDPARSFKEHPLNSALLVVGPASAVSRGAGSLGRAAKIPAFSTERAPQVLSNTRLGKARSYSRDPIVKALQVGGEKIQRSQMGRLERKAQQAEQRALTNRDRAPELEDRAATLRDQALRLDPNRLRHGQIGRLVDEVEGVNQSISAANRDMVVNPIRAMNRQARAARGAISPMAQSIVRPDVESLRSYRDHLESIRSDLSPAEAKANRALTSGLAKAIKNAEKGKTDLAEVRRLTEQHYGPLMRRLEGELEARGILPRGRAERAKLIPYAAKELGDARLPSSAIRGSMLVRGFGEPMFVTQAMNRRGAGNFYRHWSNPGSVGREGRTGTATIRGTFDADPEVMVEQVARMQGLVDAHDGFGRFVNEFSYRRRNDRLTRFETRAQADRAAADLNALPGTEWAVMRLSPWKGRDDAVANMVDGTVQEGAASQSLADVLRAAVDGEGDGPFVLVPKPAVDRLRRHIAVLDAGGFRKGFRKFTSLFSRAVLTTSTAWMAGNAIESGTRTGIARATPMDARLFDIVHREARRLDPRLAQQMEMFGKPGGHYSFSQRAPRDAGEQFQRSAPVAASIARGLQSIGEKPGPRQLGQLWDLYTRGVFWVNRKLSEDPYQKALAGKYIRQTFFPGKAFVVSRTAVEQAARGMLNTREQVAMARYVRESYGKYAHFSPLGRRAKELLPFYAWARNAAVFLYWVLPKDHPVLTALLADLNLGTEEQRKREGLDKFMGRDQLPNFLQGSIPMSGGRHLRLGRYTPFSLATDPAATAADLLLPQLSGALAALRGEDWKGKELRNPDGTPYNDIQRTLAAVGQLVEGTVPVAGKALSIARDEGGPKERLNRALNPFRPVAPRTRRGGAVPGIPTVRVPVVKVPTVELPTISR